MRRTPANGLVIRLPDTAKPKPNKKAGLARTGANTAALLAAATVLLGSAGLVLMRKHDKE
ncbi:LPXTG cell wall anchor domain-containing protein [Bifidobacterium tsurumiense]|nr:LPXTG cell wall anchor domain-containing protein [Bifidobacterium tsurumiense]